MWNVAPSNASRRRLAGETVEMAASGYHAYDVTGSASGFANLASLRGGAARDGGGGREARLSSPAFSAGVVAGDATSGVDALTGARE